MLWMSFKNKTHAIAVGSCPATLRSRSPLLCVGLVAGGEHALDDVVDHVG